MSSLSRRGTLRRLRAGGVAALLALAACGGGSQSSSSPGEASGEVPEEVSTAVGAAFEGTSGPLPDTSPSISPNHDVWVVSAFQQVSGLAKIASEIEAGAEVLGWEASVCDGQNDPAVWATCVRQATAAGADTIVLAGVDCAPVAQPLAEAKSAGVLVAGISSFDCSDPTQGGSDPLFDVNPSYGEDFESTADYFTEVGRLRAAYVIESTGGAAKVLHVVFEGVSIGEYLADGFTEEFASCGGCEIVETVAITPADVPTLRQKFDTGLLQAPDANAVVADLDFMLSLGVQQSLQEAGSGDRVVLGGECVVDTIGFMREGGGATACLGFSNGRTAWSLLDSINRAYQGEDPVESTIGWQLLDQSNQDAWPEPEETYEGPLDYRAGYTELWEAAS